jgi:hypothetical protein
MLKVFNTITFKYKLISLRAQVLMRAWNRFTGAASTTTRYAGGLDFTAKGGKRQGRAMPQSLRTTR